MEELGSDSDVQVSVGEDDGEAEEVPKGTAFEAPLEAKLRELLQKINSIEIKLCSHAAKEFIRLLKGDGGGELLNLYVQTSPKLSELLDAWKLRQGKPGISYIFSLISAILSHPDGKYVQIGKERTGTSRHLDKFARGVVDAKLDDVYKELNSKEGKRQNAALLLLASIVRRGSSLATEVAKKFNFKLQGFCKLADFKKKQNEKKRHSSRKSFVGFAMSFLEVGKPGLIRWILQQKEMFSGVLRGLGNDDDETITYILTTLRDRVLIEESLVSPGLRSVLFGSVTLEQLVKICAKEDSASTSDLAYSVLVMVCTDPCNGLMPDLGRYPNPLKGNPKRLLGVMKKLKATEIGYHKDLLLAILRGRPSLTAAYLNEFPYNLEDHASPNWLSSVSLAANVVSSVGVGHPFSFLDSKIHDPPSFDSEDMQSIMSCICPRPFSRSMINKGLLHSDFLVKHGTLRLLWEVLKLLDSFIGSLSRNSPSGNQMQKGWTSLHQEIQNEVRIILPDAQVLLTLLSSLGSHTKTHDSCLKGKVDLEKFSEQISKNSKKMKTVIPKEDTDIIVCGISSAPDITLPGDLTAADTGVMDESDREKEFLNAISEIWDSDLCSNPFTTLNDAETYLYSRLLDALKMYLRAMPTILEGSFDFFMNLLSNPLALTRDLQLSLLSLLIEYIGWSSRSDNPIKTPPFMYKHLQPFIHLLIFSPNSDIRDQAYNLAGAAMLSTGAFDRNPHEIDAWFLFLLGYGRNKMSLEDNELEVLQSLSPVVISFLCDAISTVGNNLFKYWDIVRNYICGLKDFKGLSLDFGPLVICVLQKCLRVLNSESGTFSLYDKSMISLYVCNTLKFLLQTQVDARLLSALIESILSEGLGSRSVVSDSGDFLCEWRPLNNFLLFSQSVLHQQTCCLLPVDIKAMPADGSFSNMLGEVENFLRSEHEGELTGVAKAFYSAMSCARPDEVLNNFPLAIAISQKLLGAIGLPLSSIIFSEQNFMACLSILWPEVFLPGLEMASSMIYHEPNEDSLQEILLNHSLFADEMICNIDPDKIQTGAASFSLFLKETPFHMLFPAIINVDILHLLHSSKLQDFLLAKLSDRRKSSLIFLLQNLSFVLFWFYQLRLLYKSKSLAELEDLSQICLVLVKQILSELLALKPKIECPVTVGVPLSAETIGKVAETIFCHPAVMSVLSCPLNSNEKLTTANFEDNLETFLSLSRQRVHKLDLHVLDMLAATLNYLLAQSSSKYLALEDGATNMALVKSFSALAQRIFLELRNKFDLCIASEDFLPLLPVFYTIHALIQFISPFELLEVVHWIFGRVKLNELDVKQSSMVTALSIAFCMADGAFEMLSTYIWQPVAEKAFYDLLWEMKEKTFNVDLIEDICVQLCKLACDFKLHFADICLLKALNALKGQKGFHLSDHLSSIVISRILMSIPIQMVSHCICQTNMTKAKLLLVLIELSPLHMSVFGQVFACISNRRSIPQGSLMEDITGISFSDEDYMMLIPAALSYVNATFVKFGKHHYKHFASIASFYSRMLLNGFLRWKSFVSGYLFQEEYGKFFPSCAEELFNLIEGSLLGKAICVLRYHFSLNGDSFKMKERLQLFNSIFPSSAAHEELLDCDLNEMDFCSVNQSLNLINKVVAKISFCRMLLFAEDDKSQSFSKEVDEGLNTFSVKTGSNKGNSSRMQFMNILVGTWQWMVKKLSSDWNSSIYKTGKGEDCLWLCKCLEVFILRSIYELTMKMRSHLIQLQSIPFLEQLMRSALLYRFEDPTTVRMLRHILALLLEGKFSHILYLQLLLAHSQFAPLICSISKTYSLEAGSFFKSMSSILKFLVIPHLTSDANDGKDRKEAAETYAKQLEIVKLLRTLFKSRSLNSDVNSKNAIGINLRELHSLLLFSYGATLSEIDMEMSNLMNKIELIDEFECEKTAELDYLWGSAALRVRKERALEQDTPDCVMTDSEAVEEHRRIQFRENLQVDPKVCAMTVLYFPYERTSTGDGDPLSLNELQNDDFKDFSKPRFADAGNIRRYDPVFMLRFSIHCLSSSYIEPAEFAGLGLLAIAFVSMSSPDLGMRKLGYETLGRFKSHLEKYQKKRDLMHLRLLLTYMQNGIEEPWQKIPSVVALFAAEASLILLDPLHDHCTVLSKLLTHSSRVNMKQIPFFKEFFHSSSINFRKERLWILCLAYVGLNLDDDAQIYIKDSIIETLMSFYTSSHSDNELKELILEVVKKSVKLQKMANYLVEHCGLFSWLSSILSVYSKLLFEDEKKFFLAQLTVVVEVVSVVISLRSITEWLQRYALEQLMELSCHLYKLLQRMNLAKENVALVNPILEILSSTLTLSQKREMHQPHFTLALEGLILIYQAVNVHGTAKFIANAVLGLKAILMSMAPVDIFHMSQEKVSSFLSWAISTALASEPKTMLQCNLDDTLHQECLTSKLLRWLVALVIHGKLSWKLNDFKAKFSKGSKSKTLESLLECVEKRSEEINNFGCGEILAANIYHLHQYLGVNCRFLPSVVSALCLLLFSDDSNFAGSDFVLAQRSSIMSLCSKISCPPEADPAWRWSFFEPWRDHSSELTDLQKIDQIHACQTLMAMIPNVLGKKPVDLQVLSHQDVYKWERSIIEIK
ncbi:hypothetical protein SLA2020_296340 [Shorea laevis]